MIILYTNFKKNHIMNSCDNSSNFLTVEQALVRIERDLQAIAGFEQLAIRSALNRILAEDVHSKMAVPPHNNSAMDGYAVRSADLDTRSDFKLVGTSWAGKPYNDSVNAGECIRIFTGAVIPSDCDCVIMQEDVKVNADRIHIETGHKAGQNIRLAGEDIQIGDIVLKAGKYLLPADIGLLASLGIPELKVKRRLRVAFFSTGDELCSLGEIPEAGQIYDSNRYTLYAMLTNLNIEFIDMGVIADQPEAIEAAFIEAANSNDAIITSGGVSVGDADYVTDCLDRVGKINFWKIAMKPGKPLAFGTVKNAVFFGLPGNPVSVMATFYQFVQPALHIMMGQTKQPSIRFTVPCLTGLKKHPGRVDFQRGILETDEQGQLVVRSTGQQGSGILSSMSQANCFIILPKDSGNVAAGEEVVVEPFDGLI
jgi:molybdopterin molybdotransferase